MLDDLLRKRVADLSTLYLDMDSFFASAEQQRRPDLRGQPVGVCPYISEGGCIVAASREAKRLGVKTGMRVREARQRAPGIRLVRDTPPYYRAIHAEVLKILHDTPCRVDVRGIDEMRLVVPSYLRNPSDIDGLIAHLKLQMNQRLGSVLTGSVGVGANGWQAKMASAANKPDGHKIILQASRSDFYNNIKLIDCTGIRHRLSRRLHAMGIYSVIELYQASETLLRRELGINGTKWYLRLRGVEVDDRPEQLKKSIGHQTTLMPRPAESFSDLKGVLTKIMLKVGYRLRATHRLARGMMVSVSFLDHGWWGNMIRHMSPISSHAALVDEVERLVSPLRTQFREVKKVTVVTFDFVPEGQQSWLPSESDKAQDLSGALDELRTRFGQRAIMTGSGLNDQLFPDRIGFGAPEKLLLPDL